ncbi:MAG: hypothetical protein JRN37_06965 [Nitrososphaerota archaeon]|nr:hypothetical protein [Nitrososphaerota archaeon]
MSYDLWEFIDALPPLPESRNDQVDSGMTVCTMLNLLRAGHLELPSS